MGEVDKENNLLLITVGDIAGTYMKLVLNCKQVSSLKCGEDTIAVGRSDNYTVVSCSGHEVGNIGHVILSLANTATCHVLVLTSNHVSSVKSEAEGDRKNVLSEDQDLGVSSSILFRSS